MSKQRLVFLRSELVWLRGHAENISGVWACRFTGAEIEFQEDVTVVKSDQAVVLGDAGLLRPVRVFCPECDGKVPAKRDPAPTSPPTPPKLPKLRTFQPEPTSPKPSDKTDSEVKAPVLA